MSPMMAASSVPGAEAFTIRDAEGFGLFDVGRDDTIELVSQVARGIKQHGLAYSAWAKFNEDDPRVFDDFERAYKGHYESLDAYARHLLEPLHLEELLRNALPSGLDEFAFIDYDAIGEQLFARADIVVFSAQGGGVWIFDERPSNPEPPTAGQTPDGGEQ
jgi:antirestriction protein